MPITYDVKRAREIKTSEGLIQHFTEFKKSLELYNSDEVAQLYAIFFGGQLMWSREGVIELAQTMKEKRLEFRAKNLSDEIANLMNL